MVAASNPMMPMTIIISTSVKPAAESGLVFMIYPQSQKHSMLAKGVILGLVSGYAVCPLINKSVQRTTDAKPNFLTGTNLLYYFDRNGESFHKLFLRFSKRALTIRAGKIKSGSFAPAKPISTASRNNSHTK